MLELPQHTLFSSRSYTGVSVPILSSSRCTNLVTMFSVLWLLMSFISISLKGKGERGKSTQINVYPKLGAYRHWPKAAGRRGPKTCTAKSTAQSCCEGHTWAKRAGVISTRLRLFPETSTAFFSPLTLMLGWVGLSFKPLCTGISKYVIHFEHSAKRTRCAFKQPQHVL